MIGDFVRILSNKQCDFMGCLGNTTGKTNHQPSFFKASTVGQQGFHMDLTVVNHDDHDDHDEYCKSSAGGSTFWEPPMTGDHPSGRFKGKLTMT